MADQILPKNYTAPRIATTCMCAKFRDDPEPLSRPARFHYKRKKIQKKIQKNTKKKIQKPDQFTFLPICCQIEGFFNVLFFI
jgi:hypothetical protein